ncbi:MAG: molybdate ABC transporter substrate-binding protein [Chitinophagales bacterium]
MNRVLFFQNHKSAIWIGLIFLCSLLIACGDDTSESKDKIDKPLNVATAANMQFVMDTLVKAFEAKTGITCNIILGSSGKLTAQIEQGAPYDVFVSANYAYAKRLYENGSSLEAPQICAYGQLVLWTLEKEWNMELSNLNQNLTIGTKIALPNPKFAPYGVASVAALEQAGVYEFLKDNLVYGESIAQTNQFILSGAVKAGLTAKSVVVSPLMKDRGRWKIISNTSYSQIEQTVVVLRNSKQTTKAQRFCDFLTHSENRSIWTEYGYEWGGDLSVK